jgi:hypothetical protein
MLATNKIALHRLLGGCMLLYKRHLKKRCAQRLSCKLITTPFAMMLALMQALLYALMLAGSAQAFFFAPAAKTVPLQDANPTTNVAAAAQQPHRVALAAATTATTAARRRKHCTICAAQRPVGTYVNDDLPEQDPLRLESYAEGSGAATARRQADSASKTFSRWVEVEAWRRPDLASMTDIMHAVESACRTLGALVKRAQTDDLAGMYEGGDVAGGLNIQGEAQKKLDVVSNRIMVAQLCSPGGMR